MKIRAFEDKDLPQMAEIWNTVVREANAFPQKECLDEEGARSFFGAQSFTAVAEDEEGIKGLYILHPNNVGRCGHLCNASYAIRKDCRGQHIGEQLVRHCLEKGKELGFRVLQFNAVVCTNAAAIRLYEKLGFTRLGTIPGGFELADGSYTDIIAYYKVL